jgi:hypothetical protein
VRAAETVEGHGRLYYRLGAHERAASALRAGTRRRLARAYGHRDDAVALSTAVARRTGRSQTEIAALLAGAPPTTDAELVSLATHLDRLEQEARRL